MISRLSRLVVSVLSVVVTALSAGADIKVEVFIDGDTGHGNGIMFDGSAGDNIFEIPLTGVSEGSHLISFRTTDDESRWSTTITKLLYVFQGESVEDAEYFIDTDPGDGNGIAIPVNGNGICSFVVPTSNLSVGTHTLTVRLLKNGAWCDSMSKVFAVTPSSLVYEWFFDADPGVGNASQIEASAGENIFMVPTKGLSSGAHLFSSRVRNSSGKWSVTITHTILVTEKVEAIVSAEYFVDSDPGEGNGNSVTLSDDGESAFSVPTADLAEGTHTLTLRGKDAADRWHELFSAPFEVTVVNGINSVEWKMQFNIYREGDALRLVMANPERDSRINSINLQGIVLHSSVVSGMTDTHLIPVNVNDSYIIVEVVTPSGMRSAKIVKL